MLKKVLMLINNDSETRRKLITCLSWSNKEENDLFKCQF